MLMTREWGPRSQGTRLRTPPHPCGLWPPTCRPRGSLAVSGVGGLAVCPACGLPGLGLFLVVFVLALHQVFLSCKVFGEVNKVCDFWR